MGIDEKLNRLNGALAAVEADLGQIRQLVRELTDGEGLKLKVLDLGYYTDARLEHAEREKSRATRRQAYEEAAQWRDKAMEIRKHIDLRNDLQLSSSAFRIEHGHLFYFHTGQSANDEQVLNVLNQLHSE
jgi:hypothetical protein